MLLLRNVMGRGAATGGAAEQVADKSSRACKKCGEQQKKRRHHSSVPPGKPEKRVTEVGGPKPDRSNAPRRARAGVAALHLLARSVDLEFRSRLRLCASAFTQVELSKGGTVQE